jgi:hypothetical protein
MEAANLRVFLLQHLETPRERISNLQIVVLIVTTRPAVVERGLHLPDCRNHLLRVLNQGLLLRRHKTDLVVQGVGQRRKELPWAVSMVAAATV